MKPAGAVWSWAQFKLGAEAFREEVRAFLTKYKDRILFGKDAWGPDEYRVYFRTFETEDEYFEYYRLRHAFWSLYGIGLDDDVLKHIYYKNALAIVPGLDRSLFPDD